MHDPKNFAGFWRRALAFVLDIVLITLLFQLIAVIAFPATQGKVQMAEGFSTKVCTEISPIPQGLTPLPPLYANSASQCKISIIGWPTARYLNVYRATHKGSMTIFVEQSYTLDAAGRPISGISLDEWIYWVFLAYAMFMQARSGATLGDRALSIRVFDASNIAPLGVPLRKILLRMLALHIGLVPFIAIYYYIRFVAPGMTEENILPLFGWVKYAFGVAAVWGIINLYLLMRRRDTLYDRMAGTTVLRD